MKFLLVLIFVAAFSATGKALECYQCALGSLTCNDPLDTSQPGVRKNYDPLGKYCLTAVVESGDKKTTMRDNFIQITDLPGLPDETIARSMKLTVTICNKDLCNGVSSMASTQLTLMVSTVLLIFMIWQ